MHEVEYDPVADGQSLVAADVIETAGGIHLPSLATVVDHGETIIVAFDQDAKDRCCPADQWQQRKEQKPHGVESLPETIAQSDLHPSSHIPQELTQAEGEFPSFNDRGRLLTEVGEYGRAYDQPEKLEEGKIEEQKDHPHHQGGECKKETNPGILPSFDEPLNAEYGCDVGNETVGRFPEVVHPSCKEDGIYQTRDQYPPPKPVLADEPVSLVIALYGDDDLF